MFKIFIIIFLTLWILVKLGGFFVKLFFGGLTKQGQGRQQSSYQYQQRQPKEGNVHVDFIPKNQKKDNKDFKGGDYVEYEEV